MGKLYDAIDAPLAAFIARQRIFFVATAPLGGDGHVNLSPKGYESERAQLAEWARRKGAG